MKPSERLQVVVYMYIFMKCEQYVCMIVCTYGVAMNVTDDGMKAHARSKESS